jgi:iron uptake system component EfeO
MRASTRNRRGGAAAAALLGAIALAGCGGGSGSGTTPATTATTPTATTGGPRIVEVSFSDAGCAPAELTVPSGATTFQVTNNGSTTVGEYELLDQQYVILGEVYLTADETGTFTITLQPGRYRTLCPGGTETPEGVVIVTGERVELPSTPLHLRAVASYRTFLEAETEKLVMLTRQFAAAVDAGDIDEAKRLFPISREPYERVEPVAESFGPLDPAIDAREGDVPDAEWSGFHRIEKALWVDNTTEGMSEFTRRLVADTERLRDLVKDVKLEPAQIANGAKELIDEIFTSKITGEEDRYSHTDLWDFKANLDGSRRAYESVRPLLIGRNPQLAATIEERMRAVERELQRHREGDGFVLYTSLTPADTRRLAVLLDAVAEPIGRVAALVVR